MDWESFIVDLTLTLMPVITAIGAYVLVAVGRFVLKHTDNILAKAALENLEKIILSTVSSLSQTIVDDLKRERSSKKLTTEEANLIKSKALSSINKQLGDKEKSILDKNYGCLEEVIDNILEQKVLEVKLKKGDFHY